MIKKFSVLLIFIFLVLNIEVQAENKPIQLALFTPVQIFSEESVITGFRLNLLYGRNVTVVGLDWGFVNHTTEGVSKGVQWGFVSINEADYQGWQHNSVSYTKGTFKGLQVGVVNYAGHASGVQFGLVNYAATMEGLQIGLVNIIGDGGWFPVFPIINGSF
ncbi:MAG: hypothetical protein KKH98_12670 [Spirochaetes bacterium]|nr:hypothetical protein [Spirochaetota bacterium]